MESVRVVATGALKTCRGAGVGDFVDGARKSDYQQLKHALLFGAELSCKHRMRPSPYRVPWLHAGAVSSHGRMQHLRYVWFLDPPQRQICLKLSLCMLRLADPPARFRRCRCKWLPFLVAQAVALGPLGHPPRPLLRPKSFTWCKLVT